MRQGLCIRFALDTARLLYEFAAQGGFEDLAHSWASQPVIDLKVVGHTEVM